MEDVGRICVGIALASDPAAARERLGAFAAALGAAAGLEVTAEPFWHYHNLLDALDSGQVDLAWLPPILAMRATARGRIVPLALPVRSGVSSYSTALFARADGPVRGLGDLVGLRAAWVDRQSAAGYLIIRAALRARGVALEHAFVAEQFLGVHDAVARAVLDKEADVGATFVYPQPGAMNIEGAVSERSLVARAGWGDAAVRIVALAGPIPSDVLAANTRVPAAISRAVQRALIEKAPSDGGRLARAAADLFAAEGFILPLPEHLEPLAALLAGIEDRTGASVPPRGPSIPPKKSSAPPRS